MTSDEFAQVQLKILDQLTNLNTNTKRLKTAFEFVAWVIVACTGIALALSLR
jgi:hypothetical protein